MSYRNKIPKYRRVEKLGEIFDICRGGSPRPIKSFLTEIQGINARDLRGKNENTKNR